MFTIKTLGKNGRWANTLFQYSLGKALAKKYNCELQVPADWEGRKVFKITDPPITTDLPQTKLDEIPTEVGFDLFGYWQFKDALDLYSRKDAKAWLTLCDSLAVGYNDLQLQQYNAYHVRGTDYKDHASYAHIPENVIIEEITRLGYEPGSFLKVSDETPCQYSFKGLPPWLSDFLILMNARVLFRTNSTFSYWAGILGRSVKIFSPLVEAQTGTLEKCVFIEGNWPRCTDQSNHGYGSKITDLHLSEG